VTDLRFQHNLSTVVIGNVNTNVKLN